MSGWPQVWPLKQLNDLLTALMGARGAHMGQLGAILVPKVRLIASFRLVFPTFGPNKCQTMAPRRPKRVQKSAPESSRQTAPASGAQFGGVRRAPEPKRAPNWHPWGPKGNPKECPRELQTNSPCVWSSIRRGPDSSRAQKCPKLPPYFAKIIPLAIL